MEILRWPRAVIHRLAEKVKAGTKFFIGHGKTNDHDGRETVGEVVASFVKEIGGKLSNIIIGHFPDEEKVKALDTCSMEADIHTDPENIVGDINEVSGIALGNSNVDHPAFPGAMRLAMVQCFVDTEKKEKEEITMTFEEVRKAVRELNIFPWQLFTLEDMKADKNYGKLFVENDSLKTDIEKLKTENKEISQKHTDAVKTANSAQAQERLDAMLKEGVTDKQRKFIKSRFGKDQDVSEEGIKKFIENSKKEYAETAKLFGPDEKPGSTEKKTESKNNTGESSKGEKTVEEEALELMGVPESKK